MQPLVLLLLMLGLGAGAAFGQTRPTPLQPGDKIPALRTTDQSGHERTFRNQICDSNVCFAPTNTPVSWKIRVMDYDDEAVSERRAAP